MVMHVEIIHKCLFLMEETGLVVPRASSSVVQCWTEVWHERKFLNPVMGPEENFQDHGVRFIFIIGRGNWTVCPNIPAMNC